MEYYGYTKEQLDKVIALLNTISITGLDQIDKYQEATNIIRHPIKINVQDIVNKVSEKEGEQDGKEV